MNAFVQMLRNLGPARLAAMGGVAFLMLGFLIYLMTRVANEPMDLLFSNLEISDSKRIVEELEERRVPYELRNNGTEILVPRDQALKLRVQLSETAMAGGASVGYEIFDKQSALGATNFMQNVNMVRALEGELARTITAIEGVRNARVHLVLPHRELFSRETQPPSASVVVRMVSGQLNKAQVIAIQNLIAGAVPRLQANMVALMDDKGTMLARAYGSDEEFIANTAEEMRRDYEARYTHRIEDLLTRSLGPGKVWAEVSVELDLDRVVVSKETFDADNAVPRSTVTVQDKNDLSETEPDSVSVGTNLSDAGLNAGTARQT